MWESVLINFYPQVFNLFWVKKFHVISKKVKKIASSFFDIIIVEIYNNCGMNSSYTTPPQHTHTQII